MDARTLAEQLKDIHEKMTPGPWEWEDWSKDDGPNRNTLTSPPETRCGGPSNMFPTLRNPILSDDEEICSEPNKEGIAQLRNLLPNIIEALQSQWVTITDDPGTLPDKSGEYEVAMSSETLIWDDEFKMWCDDEGDESYNGKYVTHYRLPAPPKADSSLTK
jgi:hypothetical protein